MRCSLCHKEPSEVAKLIPGQNGAVCDQCVRVANELLEEAGIYSGR